MARFIATLTILCFITVSVFGGGYGWLCVRGCKAAVEPIPDEPEETACGGCRGGGQPDSESSCPFSRKTPEPEPVTGCASESACSEADEPLCGREFCQEKIPSKSDCDKCLLPRLDFILAESKTQMPKIEMTTVPVISLVFDDNLRSQSIINTHHPGIHPVIATSVMRL